MEEVIRRKVVEAFMENNTDEAVELIFKNCPSLLYKYRKGDNKDVDALKKDKVWIGRSTFLDDEEDGNLRIENPEDVCNTVDLLAIIDEKFKDPKYKDTVRHIVQKTKNDSFVCSFSETSENEYMWKHYADNEQGFCIEYDFKDLYHVGYLLAPVSYSLKREIDISECGNKPFLVFMELYTKHKNGPNGEPWCEQEEWRIACFEKTLGELVDGKGKLISTPQPKKIIFGKNASEAVKNVIKQWIEIEHRNITLEYR